MCGRLLVGEKEREHGVGNRKKGKLEGVGGS